MRNVVLMLGLAACGDIPSDECPVNEDRCDNECVDLDVDDDNCGDCGIRCMAPESCVEGECVVP